MSLPERKLVTPASLAVDALLCIAFFAILFGRLRSHVQAARTLMASGEAVGRKLDFLSQEFNRESNTLCSKSSDIALTRVGLALKAVIDQFREQAQNVE